VIRGRDPIRYTVGKDFNQRPPGVFLHRPRHRHRAGELGRFGDEVNSLHHRSFATMSTKRRQRFESASSCQATPMHPGTSAQDGTSPTGVRSKFSNRPAMVLRGSHVSSASRSTRESNTTVNGASTHREHVSPTHPFDCTEAPSLGTRPTTTPTPMRGSVRLGHRTDVVVLLAALYATRCDYRRRTRQPRSRSLSVPPETATDGQQIIRT